MRTYTPFTLLAPLLLHAGCAAEQGTPPDGERDPSLGAGKADGTDYSECELAQVVVWLNDLNTTEATLRAAGVHTLAARNLINHRDGIGRDAPGSNLFDMPPERPIVEVDGVSWVGVAAMRALVAAVSDRCVVEPATGIEVIFSPQPSWGTTHLARLVELIDAPDRRTIDIAIYSFSDAQIFDALVRAHDRGVSIRALLEPSRDEDGTMRTRLERAGIEARSVNKVMHHKFALFDGPRDSLAQAGTAILATGSGNWSNGAGTRYDENTLFVAGNAELNLRFQNEFNFLWQNSRPFVENEEIAYFESLPIEETDIDDDPEVHALFTSANFRTYQSATYGPTFSIVRGRSEIANRLVEVLRTAESEILIASGHLRSRPVAEALLEIARTKPRVQIRILLDGQEWLSASSHAAQQRDLDRCTEAARSEAQVQDCVDVGFYFSYQVHQAGIPIRFKYYAYRWDASYAEQMHHKYFVVDRRVLMTGSYNLSDNAEHNTMENLMTFQGGAYEELIRAYVDNFETLWVTHRDDGTYDQLIGDVREGTDPFPIVFTPMALDWPQIDVLKTSMRAACRAIDSVEYSQNAPAHRECVP